MVSKVEFDTHGMTDQCPLWRNVTIDRCMKCPGYQGCRGFTVYCSKTKE